MFPTRDSTMYEGWGLSRLNVYRISQVSLSRRQGATPRVTPISKPNRRFKRPGDDTPKRNRQTIISTSRTMTSIIATAPRSTNSAFSRSGSPPSIGVELASGPYSSPSNASSSSVSRSSLRRRGRWGSGPSPHRGHLGPSDRRRSVGRADRGHPIRRRRTHPTRRPRSRTIHLSYSSVLVQSSKAAVRPSAATESVQGRSGWSPISPP